VDDSSSCFPLNDISFISWLCIILQSFFFSQISFSVFNFPTYPDFSTGCYYVDNTYNSNSRYTLIREVFLKVTPIV